MSTITDLIIEQGTEFYRTMTVTDTNKVVLNISNYIPAGQLRKSYTATAFIPFTVTVVNPLLGKISMGLSTVDSAAIPAGRYVYDVEITSSDHKTYRLLEGIATVTPNVTR